MTMQAIATRYLPAANHKPRRIVAETASGLRLVASEPIELDGEAAHRNIAERLCAELHWKHRMACGATRRGYVFVMLDD